MKKAIYLILALALLTLVFGCTGATGNPLDVVGKWKFVQASQGTAQDTFTYTITFDNAGTFTAIAADAPSVGTEKDSTFKGTYFGDPTTTPKVITLNITALSLSNVTPDPNAEFGAVTGNYYIEYTATNKLGLSISSISAGGGGYPSFTGGIFTKQ
jgi:hypothetical protein